MYLDSFAPQACFTTKYQIVNWFLCAFVLSGLASFVFVSLGVLEER